MQFGLEDYGYYGEDEDRGDDVADPAEAAAKAAEEEAARKAAEDEAARKAAAEADEEDDGDETEEERAEREAAEKKAAEEADKKRRTRIPLARHEEILKKAREREEQYKEQIRQLQSSRGEDKQRATLNDMKSDLDKLQDKYEDLILDGKKDEAKAVRKELREMQDRIADFRAATSSATARIEAIDALKYEAALAKAEQDFPELNPDNDESYNEGKVDEIADLCDALMRSNKLPRHEALTKAVKYVMGSKKDEAAVSAADKAKADDEAKKRTIEARKRAAEALNKSPANTDGAGKDNDKGGGKDGAVDIMKLSQAKFKELDDATLAKMRGDVL